MKSKWTKHLNVGVSQNSFVFNLADRQRQTETDRDRQRQTETDRQSDRQTDKQIDR